MLAHKMAVTLYKSQTINSANSNCNVWRHCVLSSKFCYFFICFFLCASTLEGKNGVFFNPVKVPSSDLPFLCKKWSWYLGEYLKFRAFNNLSYLDNQTKLIEHPNPYLRIDIEVPKPELPAQSRLPPFNSLKLTVCSSLILYNPN